MSFMDFITGRYRDLDCDHNKVPEAAPRPEKTVVFLRSMKTPAKHWEQEVKYDAWGTPYVPRGIKYGGVGASDKTLYQDGSTSDTWLYGTEWRHKSGPPVMWTPKPTSPFA